jgi:hypothetical protein
MPLDEPSERSAIMVTDATTMGQNPTALQSDLMAVNPGCGEHSSPATVSLSSARAFGPDLVSLMLFILALAIFLRLASRADLTLCNDIGLNPTTSSSLPEAIGIFDDAQPYRCKGNHQMILFWQARYLSSEAE